METWSTRPSPWRRAAAVPATLALVAAALSGCSQVQAQMDGAERSVSDESANRQALLETVEWGQVNGLVSVLMRNNSDRILRRADAVVSVRNDSGVAFDNSASVTVEGRCCTAIEVPPGGTFGFYFYAGDTTAVDSVDVTYQNVQWADAGSSGESVASIVPAHLYRNSEGSAVSADVTALGGPIDAAIVQAVVDGPDGEFLTVISGTWFCFVPGPARRIRMQIYTPLPRGSTTRTVTAYPRPDGLTGGDANPDLSCDPATDAGGGSDVPQG